MDTLVCSVLHTRRQKHTHTHTHMCNMHTNNHVYTHAHMYTHMYTHIHTCTYTHKVALANTQTHSHRYKHIHIYVYIHRCMYTLCYTQLHLWTHTLKLFQFLLKTKSYIIILHTTINKSHSYFNTQPRYPKSSHLQCPKNIHKELLTHTHTHIETLLRIPPHYHTGSAN